MNNIKKIIKLDCFSIRPYLTIKNFVIFVGLSLYYSYLAKNIVATFSMPILFALVFSGYPFLVGDEAGIDSLYRVFGIKREDVVCGRYFFAILLSLSFTIFGMILLFISSLLFNFSIEVQSIENNIIILFAMILLIVAIQYPLYFKYGYAKAKTLGFIPFILFAILASFISLFKNELATILSKISQNPPTLCLFILAIIMLLALIMFISITISKKIYSKKDF